ncbi:Major facilitator superfamily [Pyrenophora tritici-repentis]|uniref:Major facilitator superprotein n=1 Tax=Pyrenophora tritici-repentis TaxID=45151 RepID=A0A921PUS0_9PLEO|nr:Major facilitator superfamily [Pyrenophora tritici-repentis]KAG9387507.1 Major facilitator superfamily [Pyrenophora tritici-repentis]KAI0575768.1 Major facilitator superfamily [Pyrenophora tritici-repentis]KAI0606644.1 Major facilitator superfamily [Pyrenophora tritici-repentis]KAI0617716.1 Major facilitator superfamily [Pyrenophora tritici-repentis]
MDAQGHRHTDKPERDATLLRPDQAHIEEEQDKEIHGCSSHTKIGTMDSYSDTSDVERDAGISRFPTQQDHLGSDLQPNSTEIERIQTQKSQHSQTVGCSTLKSRASRKPLPAFGANKPYPPQLIDQEAYVVGFDGPDDPLHAQNWPFVDKLIIATMLGFTTFTASFGSAIFSTTIPHLQARFHVGSVVATLGTSLYVLGFATGPILWAPYSELKGRRSPLVFASFGFAIFNLAVAVAKDVQTVMICRFFGGFFGACPLTCVAAVFSDMFNNRSRGNAITIFAMAVFCGPLFAPFIGGFIVKSKLGWRWTEYITAILGFVCLGLNVIFLRETYAPQILVEKAATLRRATKNWAIHAKQDEIEIDFGELLEKNFSRPLRMLVTERIVLLITIYMSFIYGILYLFLTAYPLVFQRVHGMNPGVGGLPYFGLISGQLLAGLVIFLRQPAYERKLAANDNVNVPEWRLPDVIAGGICFAAGMFWFGWTGYKADIHWIVPTLSGLLLGFGLLAIFLPLFNYLIDSYLMFAASAIAANTFLRSLAGAAFPLFARQMFEGMGIEWASTLLGCLAVVMVPVPVWFYLQGEKIRRKSAYAQTR